MGLEILIEWARKTRNREELKKIVRKDINGVPFENDIVVSMKLLEEIEKRANLSEEHMGKAIKFERDIAEYLEELDKRGVKYQGIQEPPEPQLKPIIDSEEQAPEQTPPLDNQERTPTESESPPEKEGE